MLSKPPDKALSAEQYAAAYSANYGFEAHLVRARQNCCLRFLAEQRPRSVLEVGCGTDLLFHRLNEIDLKLDHWQIVEPSETYALNARARLPVGQVGVEIGYLESSIEALRQPMTDGYDAVLLSSVLHETGDPKTLLSAARTLLSDDGWLFVNVPNAASMHRLLAVEMGLIESAAAMSERNLLLGQRVVYDATSLGNLLAETGFAHQEIHGYMMKFLTNDQMHALSEALGSEFISGLDKLGQKFPLNASEIALTAKKR